MKSYFKEEEFQCKCGCGKKDIDQELLKLLNRSRAKSATPFIITSGVRCPQHNDKVGGSKNSSHLKGLAVDIAVTEENKDIILIALTTYFDRIGIGKNFIHVDIDNTKPKAIWYYK